MNENKKTGTSSWVFGFSASGRCIHRSGYPGLVALAGGLVNGSYEVLSVGLQDDFCGRRSIYALRPDDALASQRYDGLVNGPFVLGQISSDPGDISPNQSMDLPP
jgi:hypothetical protein